MGKKLKIEWRINFTAWCDNSTSRLIWTRMTSDNSNHLKYPFGGYLVKLNLLEFPSDSIYWVQPACHYKKNVSVENNKDFRRAIKANN